MKVLKFLDTKDFPFAILAGEFEECLYSETYDSWGQKNGEALDYSKANLEGQFWQDLAEAAERENKGWGKIVEDMARDGNWEDIVADYECEYETKTPKKLVEFCKKWDEENESLATCTAYTYWDGSNWQSIYLEDGGEVPGDVEDITDTEDGKAILKAYEEVDTNIYDGASKIEEQGGYEFYLTRYANDPYLARVK